MPDGQCPECNTVLFPDRDHHCYPPKALVEARELVDALADRNAQLEGALKAVQEFVNGKSPLGPTLDSMPEAKRMVEMVDAALKQGEGDSR